MPTAYLSPSLLQDLTNVSVSPGAGNTGYPLVWNNTSGRFELAVLGVTGGGTGATTDGSARNNLRIPEYVGSRGQNLVSNGSGLLGNNYNFSSFTFTGADGYFSPGSFERIFTSSFQTFTTDEFIPVDPTLIYTLSGFFRTVVNTAQNAFYFGLAAFDVDKNAILSYHHMYRANTTTTLALPLNPGDTTVTLTSAANWQNAAGGLSHQRGFIFWNYTNSFGASYDFSTNPYSRNVYLDVYNDGGISNNVITLKAPWSGPAFAAGTPVSNSNAGLTYKYIAASANSLPTSWTRFSGLISGVDTSGSNILNAFSPGTAFVKIVILCGTVTPPQTFQMRLTNITFSEDYRRFDRYLPTSTQESTNTTTGTIVVPGGVGIQKNLNIGGNLRFAGGTVPATAASAGTTGDIRYDGSHLYICTATNTWVRTALSTW